MRDMQGTDEAGDDQKRQASGYSHTQEGNPMPFYERGNVRIHYEEVGSGFPLLLIPGGGLNSAISWWSTGAAFNALEEFKDDFRCISMDLRNANTGQSTGPLQIEKPWDAYAERIVNISPLRRRSPSGWPPACDVICHS